MPQHSSKIQESLLFTPDLLRCLIYENVLSIVVNQFLPTESLAHIQSRLLNAKSSEKDYNGGAPINRIGRPWFTSKDGADQEKDYFDQSKVFHEYMEDICQPYQTPIDRVIRCLDHLWPGGAKIGKIEGQTMCAGLIRDITKGKSLPWHVDANRFGPDGKRGTNLDRANAILFGNVYIVTDGVGGRLQCRDQRPNPLAYQKVNNLGYGSNDISMEPDVDHLPVVGSLVMGHADKWHRVLASQGRRITSSFFVAVYDESKPLEIYS